MKTGSVRVGTGSVRLKTEDLGSKDYPLSGSPPSYPASILQHRPAPADQRNIFQPVKDWAYYEEEDRLTDKGNMLKTTNIERQREYDRRLEWEEERWKVEREREREGEGVSRGGAETSGEIQGQLGAQGPPGQTHGREV